MMASPSTTPKPMSAIPATTSIVVSTGLRREEGGGELFEVLLVMWQAYCVRMTVPPLHLSRDLEFPRVIVWDALLEPDLVSGWLGEAQIVPEVGGEYNIAWVHHEPVLRSYGRITALQPLELLYVDTLTVGRWKFVLDELEGGSRGTSTRLDVVVELDIDEAFAGRMRADWLTNLDQLEDLLRGHPVDWAHWTRDRYDAWYAYLDGVDDSTA